MIASRNGWTHQFTPSVWIQPFGWSVPGKKTMVRGFKFCPSSWRLHSDPIDWRRFFFKSVSAQCWCEHITKFINATGSDALASAICVVCAGCFFCTEVDSVSLRFLRDTNKLSPTSVHSDHVLTDRMLLHWNQECYHADATGDCCTSICVSCLASLRKGKTLCLALVNGMWVGDVPLILCVLMLPECVLVAHFFPAAYIVKLYPMRTGAWSWPSNGFHSSICGNVSTYRLNMDDIVHMTDTQTMPPSSILAATIGVTFVGPQNLPQKTMLGFLWVNCNHVHNTLLWLKLHNPIYQDIIISTNRLEQLPVDGISNEIYALAKHSDDLMQLGLEDDRYIPNKFAGNKDESDSKSGSSDDDQMQNFAVGVPRVFSQLCIPFWWY